MNTRIVALYRQAPRVFLCAALLGAILLALPRLVQARDGEPPYIREQIVIKLYYAADLAAVAADYGLDPAPLSQFGSRAIYVLRITDGEEAPDKVDEMEDDPRVQYVELNHRYSAPEGQKRSSWARVEDASEYAEQWAADKIRLPAAHTVTRGLGVIVAVLDTGVDASHPALAGKLLRGYDFVDDDTDPSEVGNVEQDLVYGHGTHVAGIVALTAPEAKILPLRVLDRNGEGNVWVLAEALYYALDPDGDPATDDGATVINLSLGTSQRTRFLDDVLDAVTCQAGRGDDDEEEENDGSGAGPAGQPAGARPQDDDECLSRRGAVIVAAAGNNGTTDKEYPAAEESAALLAVAATTEADTRAPYSNYGPWVALGAPGDLILSSVPGSLWGAWSGTSMAAPFVAGVAALVQSHDSQLPPPKVAHVIVSTSQAIAGDVRWRVDAAAAVNAPPAPPTPPTPPTPPAPPPPATRPMLFLPALSSGGR